MVVLFSKHYYQLTLILLLSALFGTFINRAAQFDEAWFAEQSFWLIRAGHVRSELFHGYNGWEDHIFVFHKLFVYAGALVMSITGISVGTCKLVSIFFSLLGGYLVWRAAGRISQEQRWLSLILYFGCGSLIRYAAVNRPETMCMALGFGSYLSLKQVNSSPGRPLLAGSLAGLAAFTHLNGLIYLVSGAIWLVVKKGWRSASWFALAGVLTISLYGLDALWAGKLALLVNQFLHDPATQENLHVTEKLTVLVNYHQIFFHSQNEAALTLLVLLSAIAFRHRIRLLEPTLFYTMLLVVSFWFLTKSDTDIYFLLFLPWLAVLVADWLVTYLPDQPHWQKIVARLFLGLYLVISAVQLYNVMHENKTAVDIEARNKVLASHMPRNHTNIIAPIEFFFGQIDNYNILGLTYFHLLEREQGLIPLSVFFQRAAQRNIDYIVSDYGVNASYNIPIHAPSYIGQYQRIYQDNSHSIYARQTGRSNL